MIHLLCAALTYSSYMRTNTQEAKFLSKLFESVMGFVDRRRRPIYVTLEDDMEKVLQLLVKRRVHRAYIVDPKDMHPMGVVSFTDILRELLPHTISAPS